MGDQVATKASTTWYLWVDAKWNESIAQVLVRSQCTEAAEAIVDYRGEEITVWQVPYWMVDRVQKNKDMFEHRPLILMRLGDQPVRKWNLQCQPTRRRNLRLIRREMSRKM